MSNSITLEVLPNEYAVARLKPDAEIPGWATAHRIFSITRTHDELSILCRASDIPDKQPAQRGFHALRVRGPLDFAAVGILASIVGPLAGAGISIFSLSTYDTDYIFLQETLLERAVKVLTDAGLAVERAQSN